MHRDRPAACSSSGIHTRTLICTEARPGQERAGEGRRGQGREGRGEQADLDREGVVDAGAARERAAVVQPAALRLSHKVCVAVARLWHGVRWAGAESRKGEGEG